MTLHVSYSNRDFTKRAQPMLNQSVRAMRWSDLGWCDQAEITSVGNYRDVGDLLELLRCPVEIMDNHGNVVWWGYANSLSYSRGSMRITYSLDTMFNTIKVAYSWVEPGTNVVGTRKTTAATTDTDSVGFYGTKELLKSTGGMTDAAALTYRNNLLAQLKYPVGIASGDGASLPAGGTNNTAADITIGCKGWIYTLGWRLATVGPMSRVRYVGTSATTVNFGNDAARAYGRQSITITESTNIIGLWLGLGKVVAPVDNLIIGIYLADANGDPSGSALATCTIAGASLTTTLTLTFCDLTADVPIAAGTVIAIKYSRSGAVDATNYYKCSGYAATGYAGGDWKIFDGASYAADAAILDTYFDVLANPLVETTRQIRDLIYTYGVMLDYNNVTITDASTITRYANLAGDTYALAEIQKLQELGYSDAARMVIKVTPGRQVEIYKASSTALYKADSYNRIYNAKTNEPIRPYVPPVGSWIELTDLTPETADTSRLITPGLQYLQAYEWRDGITTPIYELQEELQGALSA